MLGRLYVFSSSLCNLCREGLKENTSLIKTCLVTAVCETCVCRDYLKKIDLDHKIGM